MLLTQYDIARYKKSICEVMVLTVCLHLSGMLPSREDESWMQDVITHRRRDVMVFLHCHWQVILMLQSFNPIKISITSVYFVHKTINVSSHLLLVRPFDL